MRTRSSSSGERHANGEGVPQDQAEAVKRFRKAAEQGDAGAQSKLVVMCERAEGTSENRDGTAAVFAAFANVDWAPAIKRGDRTFDDKQFFDSVRKQFENGRTLTEKQIATLVRILGKYSAQVSGAESLIAAIDITHSAADSAVAPTPEANHEVDAILAKLAMVKICGIRCQFA